jgi:hypothetical protein
MKTKTAKSKNSHKPSSGATLECYAPARSSEEFESTATAAYFKAEARGFAPGKELEDWLDAEAELGTRGLR